MQELTGVILCAGKGSRIDPFNTQFPKPLLPIGNMPILGHHLQLFRSLGIKRVHVVVGHLMDRIINEIGRKQGNTEIHYVEQTSILGIAHAVGRVEPWVDGPFVLVLGDIFYLASDMGRIVERYARGDVAGVLAVKEESSPERVSKNFTVETDSRDLVTRVIEKPRSPKTLLKGCGVYLFGPEVFDAIHRTPRTALRDEYEITNSIQIMIEDGLGIAAEPVIDWDLNVTFPRDLLEGNLHYLEHGGMQNLVAPEATVPSGARLTHCVVGAGASVHEEAEMDSCVVFPGTAVASGGSFSRTLFSGDLVISC